MSATSLFPGSFSYSSLDYACHGLPAHMASPQNQDGQSMPLTSPMYSIPGSITPSASATFGSFSSVGTQSALASSFSAADAELGTKAEAPGLRYPSSASYPSPVWTGPEPLCDATVSPKQLCKEEQTPPPLLSQLLPRGFYPAYDTTAMHATASQAKGHGHGRAHSKRKELPDRAPQPRSVLPSQIHPHGSSSRKSVPRKSPPSKGSKHSKAALSSADTKAEADQGNSSDRAARDEYLLDAKRKGMTYREIRLKGGFTEAESTLRGRYRTLTKSKENRVRKPEWEDKDVCAAPISSASAVQALLIYLRLHRSVS